MCVCVAVCAQTQSVCAEGKVSIVCPLFWPSGTSGGGTAPAATPGALLLLVPLQREWEEAFWGSAGWFYVKQKQG